MENKILDLTDVTDEAFEVAQKCIESWKEDGAPTTMVYSTVAECQQYNEDLSKAFGNTFQNGFLWAGIALVGGWAINKGIDFVVDFVSTKIKEKQG